MTTDQSTELIWHFIGYLHMEELLSKMPIYYSGAYVLPDEDKVFDTLHYQSMAARPDRLNFEKIKKVDFSDEIVLPDAIFELPRLPDIPIPLNTSELIELAHQNAPNLTPKTPAGGGVPNDDAPLPNFKIHVSYVFGEDQHQWIDIDQRNFMTNTNLLLSGANDGITEAHNIDAEAVLASMLEEARDEFSDLEYNLLEQKPEEIAAMMRDEAAEIWADAEAEWAEYVEETGDTETPMPYPGEVLQGTYDNGELVVEEDTDENSEGQVGDGELTDEEIAAAEAEAAEAEAEAIAEAEASGHYEGVETETDTGIEVVGQDVHITTNWGEPTGGNAQIATTGGNDATNSALISDYSDGYGSIIVLGDVYATNAIFQVNVLHDNDLIDFDADDAALALANSGNNSTDNIAEFTFDTQTLIGNPAFGNLPIGLNWNVDYIDGNFYDVKIVTQYNDLFNNDTNEQSTTNTHFVGSLGDNSQTNIAQILDYGKNYDLIIIEGDVYELNLIAQVNLLLDDDIIMLNSNGDWDTTQSLDAGSNVLLNDAVIINVGGGDYHEITDDAEDLAEQIGDMETDIDYDLGEDIPGNGSNEVNVLYITGDFYDLKAIYQLNIMSDADVSEQSMADDDQIAADDGALTGFEQSVETGGNTETNSAVIIDVDSTSDYQYLDGNYYQNDVLVQANIIEEDGLEFDTEEGLLEATIALLEDQANDGDELHLEGEDLPDNIPIDDGLASLLG